MPTARARKKHRVGRRLLLLGVALLLLLWFLDSQLRPTITAMAGYYAKQYATEQISQAVQQAIRQQGGGYDDYTQLQTGADGRVLAITTNARQITAVHTSIIDSLTRAMRSLSTADLSVPIGSLSGTALLSGIGPSIQIRMLPRGAAESQITSSLQEAGINQTLHTIRAEVSAEITALIPGYSTTVQVQTRFLLAESVVVGEVPNYYTKVVSDSGDAMSNISRYGNPRFPNATGSE